MIRPVSECTFCFLAIEGHPLTSVTVALGVAIAGQRFLVFRGMSGRRAQTPHLVRLPHRSYSLASITPYEQTELGFSFHRPGPVKGIGDYSGSVCPVIERWSNSRFDPVYRQDIIGLDGCIMRPSLGSSRIGLGFHRDLYVGYCCGSDARRVGDLTGQTHEPFSRGETMYHRGV